MALNWHSTDYVKDKRTGTRANNKPCLVDIRSSLQHQTKLSSPCHTMSAVLPAQWYPYRFNRKVGPIAGLNMVVKKKSLYSCCELSCSFLVVQPTNWSLHSLSYPVYNYDEIKAKINKDQS